MRESSIHWALSVALLAAAGISGGAALAGTSTAGFVAAGSSHTCAVSRGGAQCWGYNYNGQLGDGTTNERLYPTYVDGLKGGNGVTAVAAGRLHSCAVAAAGLLCWGDNGYGQLGVPGASGSEPVSVFAAGSGVTAVSAGSGHTCAIVDHSLLCWGQNSSGQLGTGDNLSTQEPVLVIGSGVTAVAAGDQHTCAVVNGGLQCWGSNESGQLGLGTTDPASSPEDVPQMDSGVTAVAAGASSTCAVLQGDHAYCWGANDTGELGIGMAGSSSSPVSVVGLSGVPITSIALGGTGGVGHACAVVAGGIQCWGYNGFGQLGDGAFEVQWTPEAIAYPTNVVAVAAGEYHTCVMSDDESVYCAGYDGQGALGDHGPPLYVTRPATSAALAGFTQLSGGGSHSCGIAQNDAYCWGDNDYGQLGRGTDIGADAWPDRVAFVLPGGIEGVSAGGAHSCALTASHTVYCWGHNNRGQIGDGGMDESSLPQAVSTSSAITAVSAGSQHSCAVTANGNIECWGAGTEGQLGSVAFADALTPVTVMRPAGQIPIALTGATSVAASYSHTCAIADEGVRCWGGNDSGQLGNGSTTASSMAVSVSGLTQLVTGVATGYSHSCAVQDGTARCWGSNESGQLGTGTYETALTPASVLVGDQDTLTGVTAIAAGDHHSCAIADGGVACWGYNAEGQLGTGSLDEEPFATFVLAPGLGITEIAAGASHTCAASGVLTWCWGYGLEGRLSNGALGYSARFVIADAIFVGDLDTY